jgi:hypothetical protein
MDAESASGVESGKRLDIAELAAGQSFVSSSS